MRLQILVDNDSDMLYNVDSSEVQDLQALMSIVRRALLMIVRWIERRYKIGKTE